MYDNKPNKNCKKFTVYTKSHSSLVLCNPGYATDRNNKNAQEIWLTKMNLC